MTKYYVKSSTGVDTNDGLTWATAKATLAGADAIDAAGDEIYVSPTHLETNAATVTYNFAGTNAAMTKLISADDTANPPNAVLAGAVVKGATINLNGPLYSKGMSFICGEGQSNIQTINLGNGSTDGGGRQVYENTKFTISTTSAGGQLQFGRTANQLAGDFVLRNPIFKFAAAGQGLGITRGFVRIQGGSIDPASAALSTAFFRNTNLWIGGAARAVVDGMDLSMLAAGCALAEFNNFAECNYVFRNCKLPAGWTGNVATGTPIPGGRVEMYNCDSGNTNYRMGVADYAGTVKTETTLIKTGGASDDDTPISWKMATNANASYFNPLASVEVMEEFPGTPAEVSAWTPGASKTVSMDVLVDSAVALNNDEIWLEVQYQANTGSSQSAIVSNRKADTLTAAAAQPTSATTWTTTGMTNPLSQTLSVSITPQQKGILIVRLMVAKPNAVVYADPKLIIA